MSSDTAVSYVFSARYVLEDGGMKQTDQQQLDFKRKVDPLGLFNPGKMRAFEEGRANFDGTAGFDRIRVGEFAMLKSMRGFVTSAWMPSRTLINDPYLPSTPDL